LKEIAERRDTRMSKTMKNKDWLGIAKWTGLKGDRLLWSTENGGIWRRIVHETANSSREVSWRQGKAYSIRNTNVRFKICLIQPLTSPKEAGAPALPIFMGPTIYTHTVWPGVTKFGKVTWSMENCFTVKHAPAFERTGHQRTEIFGIYHIPPWYDVMQPNFEGDHGCEVHHVPILRRGIMGVMYGHICSYSLT